jgi:hypothetical protein
MIRITHKVFKETLSEAFFIELKVANIFTHLIESNQKSGQNYNY